MSMAMEEELMKKEMIGKPWVKVDETDVDDDWWLSCQDMEEVASIAANDFALRKQHVPPSSARVEAAEYTIDVCAGVLYNLNIMVDWLPPSAMCSGLIQVMVWKGVVWEDTKISPLGSSRLPPSTGDMRGASRNLMHQRPDLKQFAWEELREKLEPMGLLIDNPNNTLTPILSWGSRPIKRTAIGAGFVENVKHSIIVRVKPFRGKKSKPGLHGLWKLTIRERRWIITFSPQDAASFKHNVRLVQQTTFPSMKDLITHDEKTGRALCVIRTLTQVNPVLLGSPLIVTLALFALHNHNRKKGLELKFKRVVNATHRKVAGAIYLLTLEASYKGILETYMTSVTKVSCRKFLKSTPLVKQESSLPKHIKHLFQLGKPTSCYGEEEQAAASAKVQTLVVQQL